MRLLPVTPAEALFARGTANWQILRERSGVRRPATCSRKPLQPSKGIRIREEIFPATPRGHEARTSALLPLSKLSPLALHSALQLIEQCAVVLGNRVHQK